MSILVVAVVVVAVLSSPVDVVIYLLNSDFEDSEDRISIVDGWIALMLVPC